MATRCRRHRRTVAAVSPVGENARVTDVVDVILRDGSTLRLRPPARDDADAILDFFRALSGQSLYMRFHGFPLARAGASSSRCSTRTGPSAARCSARSSRTAPSGSSRSRTTRACATPPLAEAAFAVADAYQRRGVGTRLVEQLAERAARHGIERFVALVLPDNRRMLGVFEALGFELTRELAGGEVEVTFPIAAHGAVRGAASPSATTSR